MHTDRNWLHELLEDRYQRYNRLEFIETDPISIPHRYSKKEDIEISAFIMATLAWGNRKAIIKSGEKWMEIMEDAPHDFVIHHTASERKKFSSFVYRTFNGVDAEGFMKALQTLYRRHGGLQSTFKGSKAYDAIQQFRNTFIPYLSEQRSHKHVSDPSRNSSAKRLNMFLRWMVRNEGPVDFGIWDHLKPADLIVPLDVHTGNISRMLGLLERSQDDRKAAEELTTNLQYFDPIDPVKYDYALFGIGAFEKEDFLLS